VRVIVGVVASLQHRSGEPLFASEPLTGVSRRCAPLPSAFEVAPVVIAYLRQQGQSLAPPELAALLPAPAACVAPARSRETVILVAVSVVLFIAAFAVAFALLPNALG
jgi:hypothetical protein